MSGGGIQSALQNQQLANPQFQPEADSFRPLMMLQAYRQGTPFAQLDSVAPPPVQQMTNPAPGQGSTQGQISPFLGAGANTTGGK